MTNVLFIGLGRMGLPMAQHALRAGLDVRGYDVAADRMRMFAESGGRTVEDLGQAIAEADAIMIMTGSQSQADELFNGVDGVFARGRAGVLAILISTVAPDFASATGDAATKYGVRLVDAPVCRAEMGAIAGNLLAFLAGERSACDDAARLMKAFCADIEHVGDRPGAAQVAKTINNLILWACVLANVEGLQLAERWSLDVAGLRRALLTSSADNWALRNWDRVSEMRWSIKDMEIALETGSEAGVDLPLSEIVERLVRVSPVLTHATID